MAWVQAGVWALKRGALTSRRQELGGRVALGARKNAFRRRFGVVRARVLLRRGSFADATVFRGRRSSGKDGGTGRNVAGTVLLQGGLRCVSGEVCA